MAHDNCKPFYSKSHKMLFTLAIHSPDTEIEKWGLFTFNYLPTFPGSRKISDISLNFDKKSTVN